MAITNEQKAINIALENVVEYHTIDDNGTEYLTHCYNECKKSALDMAKWKDEQINLLLDAIDYAYLKTDGTYGDLALVVADKVEYLKSLRHGKIE